MATIAWLVPNLLEGSGGHRTILQQRLSNAETLPEEDKCLLT